LAAFSRSSFTSSSSRFALDGMHVPPAHLLLLFGIEIDDCGRCGGRLKVIASIEDPEVIAKILAHLEKTAPDQYQPELPLGARASPSQASQSPLGRPAWPLAAPAFLWLNLTTVVVE